MTPLLFVAGLAALVAGAEALVRGASRLATALGVSSLVIGLTVVAFGTSMPEFAVSAVAGLAGQPGIAVGNVVGSNIFNVLFILGISALVTPLRVSAQLVRLDVPLMIALSVLVELFALDGRFGRLEGLLLLAVLVAYVGYLARHERRVGAAGAAGGRETAGAAGGGGRAGASWRRDASLIAGGLVLLVLGSRWLVEGAVAIARALGVGEAVIGLTIVAAGTSLPEVVTSAVAALRREPDIAIGNVVGSNVFNILGVLGFAAAIAPAGIEVSTAFVGFDIPAMIVTAVACLPIFFTGCVVSRPEGLAFLGSYVAYTAFLVLAATRSDALPRFGAALLFFAVPLTLLTLGLAALREWRTRRRSGRGCPCGPPSPGARGT